MDLHGLMHKKRGLERMNYPKVLSEKEIIGQDSKYIFISYSHCDSAQVYKDLFSFYDAGINYWYDKELKGGEAWNEVVQTVLRSDNCVGVLFYLSPQSIMSAAVAQEISIAKQLYANNPNFYIAGVSLDGKSINSVVQSAYVSLSDYSDSSLNMKFPPSRVVQVLETFREELIYFSHVDKHMCERFIDAIRAKKLDIINNQEQMLRKLEEKNILDKNSRTRVFNLGVVMQRYNGEIDYHGVGDFEIDGQGYRKENGRIYCLDKIEWNIIKADNNIMILLSKKAIDISSVERFEIWKDDFLQSAFVKENKDIVVECRLPNFEECTDYRDIFGELIYTDYASYKRRRTDISVYATGVRINNMKTMVMNQKAVILKGGMLNNAEVAIRPILVIDAKKI